MNEMANLCTRVGADIEHVRKGISTDKRIGPYFIFPGVGYGGSCFPKDVKALIRTAKDFDFDTRVLKSVEDVNEDQKKILIPTILEYFDNDISQKTLTLWGLSFKPKTDDMREAPSRVIAQELQRRGAKLQAHDPVAMDEARRLKLDEIAELFDDNYDALKGSDGLVLVTEWLEYREPDFEKMKSLMKHAVIFDGRNVYNPGKMRELGFDYFGIGRS
jgi:UDPglucose 6-dehydrogenase